MVKIGPFLHDIFVKTGLSQVRGWCEALRFVFLLCFVFFVVGTPRLRSSVPSSVEMPASPCRGVSRYLYPAQRHKVLGTLPCAFTGPLLCLWYQLSIRGGEEEG